MKDNLIVDAFAGGGGASVGIEMALGRSVDIAINHDPEAIRMHTVNHPGAIHLTEDILGSIQTRKGDPAGCNHHGERGGDPEVGAA